MADVFDDMAEEGERIAWEGSTPMPAAGPDPRFRDKLAEALCELRNGPSGWKYEAGRRWWREEADALLPLIAADVRAQVQAAANQRTAALAQAWSEGKLAGLGVTGDVGRNPYRAALAQPAPATVLPAVSTAECPLSQRVDGQLHSWSFDGDDPYVVCAYCDQMQDALTGRVIREGRTS